MDEEIALHSLSIRSIKALRKPELVARFQRPTRRVFLFKSENELMLWLDASDASTITKVEGTDELEVDQIKSTPAVEMKSWNHKPTFINSHLSGRTGLKIYSENGQRRVSLLTKMVANGIQPEKMVLPVVLYGCYYVLLWRVDEFTRTTFPFNMGWGDHFPWDNGHIYWRFWTTVKVSGLDKSGIPILTTLEFRSQR